jgi:hypothetical protein
MADLTGLIEVLPTASSDPLTVDGLTARRGDRMTVLLANLTADAQTVTITDLPDKITACALD